ncbi:PREDICTED: uncharacterized protein LOC107189657 [Dufourea novaeangliae]|uniref:uncharacterized protein LOC107189657 n=1 Tax=Dufourea novaeangliae TaxID=178035 RepID=UPI0007679D39|nr:PREDICTED: uncharacterized protein LOC107189657 [Dufourea novaeangliae]
MNDEQLIELVRQYPVLYDVSHPKYMNTSLKLDIWNKIGRNIRQDVSVCKARWNNIRDNYKKCLRKTAMKRRQNAKKIRLYKYSEQLSFLKKYIDERKTNTSIDSQEKGQEYDRQEENNENDVEKGKVNAEELNNVLDINDDLPCRAFSISNCNTFEIPTNPTIQKTAMKTVIPQQTASSQLMEYLINKNPNKTSEHPVDAFLTGIATTLKTLSPYNLNLAKSEIFSIVQKYELKMISEQHSCQERSNQMCSCASSSSLPISTPLLSPTEKLEFTSETYIQQ